VAIELKSGNLKFLEPLGPAKACNGIALPFWLEWQRFLFVKGDASVYFLELFNEPFGSVRLGFARRTEICVVLLLDHMRGISGGRTMSKCGGGKFWKDVGLNV